jgi:predicted nucleic acid-binding protein
MRVLLDTNILLDVLLNREPFVADSSAIWAACELGTSAGFVSGSALTDIFLYCAPRRRYPNSTHCHWPVPCDL